ncbi:hypothetical protein HELRODRAFT_189770 [Helobdella robusta]|uniref:Uncharacterized protein n=1 Tax=Helobdella robusta TaxID=6412 RepID=T1FRD0_HELRO|nr:hypothetical protein HELRODRAFT_189770 [Helobdella robusta]ESN91686.1 hypothetical protein HELRODRAFT_189770 [Helobdella robusta]
MKTGLVGSISVLIGVIMLFTNISHTPTVIWFFRNCVPDLSSKLKLDPCLLNILINVSATYSFLFPISSTHCLICYLSGGITKKDMVISTFECGNNNNGVMHLNHYTIQLIIQFANGAVIMTVCFVTFFASFAQLIQFFGLEYYSPKYEDEPAKNGSLCVLKFGLRKFL